MKYPFFQGYLDSLCGIYSILNADRIVNNSPIEETQDLFKNIIKYLNGRNLLESVILEGSDHKIMKSLIKGIAKDRFPLTQTNKRGIIKLSKWWEDAREFLEGGKNRTIILSLGGRAYHLTVVERISDRSLFLQDSSWDTVLRRSMCRISGYTENDKYIIYPSQCWYLGKE